jgi:hypothetical protein
MRRHTGRMGHRTKSDPRDCVDPADKPLDSYACLARSCAALAGDFQQARRYVAGPPLSRLGPGHQNRQFKPKLTTVALVSYEPIKKPADGLPE